MKAPLVFAAVLALAAAPLPAATAWATLGWHRRPTADVGFAP